MRALQKDAVVAIQSLKAADNESLTGTGVDMRGKKGVAFSVIALKGEALDFTIKAQQAAESDYSDAADILGSSVAFSTTIGADGLALLEIKEPGERYVRPIIAVPDAAAATPVSCISIAYGGDILPESNTNAELHVAAAEGTA